MTLPANPFPDEAALAKLRKARADVVASHPFFGVLLLRQQPVETAACETMATDGRHLYYSAAFVRECDPAELRAVCMHEALHPAFDHHGRKDGREHQTWNMAADYVINPIVRDAGATLPSGALFRDDLEGLTAEQAYRILERERREAQQSADDDTDTDEEQSDDEETSAAADSGADDETDDDSEAAADDDGADDEGADEEQSDTGADGADEGAEESAEDETGGADEGAETSDDETASGEGDGDGDGEGAETVADFGGCGAVIEADFEDDREAADDAADWRVALTQAANLAAASGGVPSGAAVLIESVTSPRVDWRELLRDYLTARAQSDYTWSRPNRRFVGAGMYLPSLHTDACGPLALVVDVSGSMPRDALEAVLSELDAVRETMAPEWIDVYQHDEGAAHVARIERDDDLDGLPLAPGGGTAFGPMAELLRDSDEDYAAVVWFTDLCAPDIATAPEPDAPVIWLDHADGYAERIGWRPTFGDVVRMSDY